MRAEETTLVLGAGGPVGFAFHAGVLRALAHALGWDARRAALVIGTSAGAQIAAMLRAGLDADEIFARTRSPPRRDSTAHARSRKPASPIYLRHLLRRPWRAHPAHVISALLPAGRRDCGALHDAIARLHPLAWPREALWIPAVALDRGARVVFGRGDAPAIDVATAVCASSAVPGLRAPIVAGGVRYVDGGVASSSNLDLAAAAPPRNVIVCSPLSRFWPLRIALARQKSRLAARGLHVLAFEPRDEITAWMGWNPLDAQLAAGVAEASFRVTLRSLDERQHRA
jgi:NTE family protein